MSKITPAIQSRCTRFRFGPLNPKQILPRLNHVIAEENLIVSNEGKKALLKLGEGDMRKVLNILQSTALAFSSSKDSASSSVVLNEEQFYLCTGAPLPADIQQITNWMLTDDLTSAFDKIFQLKTLKGLALTDIITQIHKFIERIDFPEDVRIYLLQELATLEYRLALGTNEKLQLGTLVAIFYNARNMVANSDD